MKNFTRLFLIAVLLSPAQGYSTQWDWVLTGGTLPGATGTFAGCESTTKTKISGSFVRHESGHVKLTKEACSTCSDSSCGTSCVADTGECAGIPTTIDANDVVGVHLLVQPVLTNPTVETQLSYNIEVGPCPTRNETYNFIFSQWSAGNNTASGGQIGAGVFNWETNGTATVNEGYNLTSFNPIGLTFTLPNSGCNSGIINTTGTPNSDHAGTIYLTSKREFFYQTEANHAIFGVPQVPITDKKALMGLYSGFVYDGSGTNTVTPVMDMLITSTADSVSGFRSNNGVPDPSFQRSFTFTDGNINQPVPGMISGVLSDGTNTSNMICVVQLAVAGKNNLFCVGQKPNAPSTSYNLLLTSTAVSTVLTGNPTVNQPGVYGVQGTPTGTTVPGSRWDPLSWVDVAGNFWLFGGYGRDSAGATGKLNDLWKWNGSQWTWVKGSSTVNASGVYGTKNVASAGNVPGSREESQHTTDRSGNLWLFGGAAHDSSGSMGSMNDLWKFNGTNWVWVWGDNLKDGNAVYGTRNVTASTNRPGARTNGTLFSDASERLYLFGGYCRNTIGGSGPCNDLWRFDGTNWTWLSGYNDANQRPVFGTKGVAAGTNRPPSMYGMVGWTDSNNMVWLYGGYGYGTGATVGYFNTLWKFDGTNWTWVSGSDVASVSGVYGTKGVGVGTNTPGSRQNFASMVDAAGNFWLFGGNGTDSAGANGALNDLWKWDGTNWTWVAGSKFVNQSGIYGTLGSSASGNFLGGRERIASWMDLAGNIWLWGGKGYDSVGTYDALNDMWLLGSFTETTTATARLRMDTNLAGAAFGDRALNSSADYTVTITNDGHSGVAATSMGAGSPTLAAPFSFKGGTYPGILGTCGTSLADGESCTLVLSYAASSYGTHSDTVRVAYHDGTATQTLSRRLTGEVRATLSLSDGPTYDYGYHASATNTDKTFTLTNNSPNTGATAVALGTGLSARYGWPTGSFPGGGTCGTTLAAGASCTIILRFNPVNPVGRSFPATLRVNYHDGSATTFVSIAVKGNN